MDFILRIANESPIDLSFFFSVSNWTNSVNDGVNKADLDFERISSLLSMESFRRDVLPAMDSSLG